MGNCAVILAAGDGKRMKANHSKVLCEILGSPMLDWVMNTAKKTVSSVCAVIGRGGNEVKARLSGRAETAEQSQRLGTGHAVLMAVPYLERQSASHVLILNGDAPLMDAETVSAAFEAHIQNENDLTVISASINDPAGYGRIVRHGGAFSAIIEERDADASQKSIKEVNSGAYWFKRHALLRALPLMTNDNAGKELYLTQTVEIIKAAGGRCAAHTAENPDVILGANDRMQLIDLEERARRRIIARHMENGVRIPSAFGILIGPHVEIKPGCVIMPNVILTGRTVVGKYCTVGPYVSAHNAIIGDGAVLSNTNLRDKTVSAGEA
ncbi:MAG TPA: cytidylyltransferase [Ruminococcaceae bacterium]|nr:cytidylyltransferase [Oscillospiraceae bacterium]